jgi:uncharacterized protein (DUF2384 family)
MRRWNCSNHEVITLTGLTPHCWLKMRNGEFGGSLTQGQTARISKIASISTDLLVSQGGRGGDWLRLPNISVHYAGKSPMDLMLTQGLQGLTAVAELLKASRSRQL